MEEDTEAQGKVACSVTYVVSGRIRICTWVKLFEAWSYVPNLILFFLADAGKEGGGSECLSVWSKGLTLGKTEALSWGLLER